MGTGLLFGAGKGEGVDPVIELIQLSLLEVLSGVHSLNIITVEDCTSTSSVTKYVHNRQYGSCLFHLVRYKDKY